MTRITPAMSVARISPSSPVLEDHRVDDHDEGAGGAPICTRLPPSAEIR